MSRERILVRIFGKPISTNWQKLTKKQAGIFLICGLFLEIPIRFLVRPDMSDLVPGNPWFHSGLRLAIEAGMVAVFFLLPTVLRIPSETVGIPRRRWTRWEWSALLIIGGIELIIVGALVGTRWVRLWEMGLVMQAIPWVAGEFLFGMNQETGFRGLIMTGILRLRGTVTAYIVNTLIFLVGPLHGSGIIEWIGSNPVTAIAYGFGVVVHGVAYSWIRHRTDNVVLCAILHGIINGSMNGVGLVLRAAA